MALREFFPTRRVRVTVRVTVTVRVRVRVGVRVGKNSRSASFSEAAYLNALLRFGLKPHCSD